MQKSHSQTEIMQIYRSDPKRGFDCLYLAIADKLVTYAKRNFGFTQQRAEDAVHDVLLPWVEQPERMKDMEKPFSYLFTSVRNACMRGLRKEKRTSDQDLNGLSAKENYDPAISVDIQSALTKMPDEQREAIVLRIWGNLSLHEVAEIQEVSLQTVASRYRYGLAKMKEVLS